jgi:hypothetical protein
MSEPNVFEQAAQAMADMQADHDRVLAQVVADRDRLRAAVDAALALHQPCFKHSYSAICHSCRGPAPCETHAALAPVADPDPHTTSEKEQQ